MKYDLKFTNCKKNMYDKGILILKSEIKMPYLTNFNKHKFNEFYKSKKLEIQEEMNNYYNEGKDIYNVAVINENSYNNYEYAYLGNEGLNDNNIISLYFDKYIYAGGAHGDEAKDSETWDMEYNKIVELKELFNENYDYKKAILNNIEIQIKNNDSYFSDINKNLDKYFDQKKFYLTKNNLIIYYPKYTIAPGVSGIVEFKINYNRLNLNNRYQKLIA